MVATKSKAVTKTKAKSAVGGGQTARAAAKSTNERSPKQQAPEWDLRLYVAGQTPKSLAAFRNLKKICEERLAGQYRIEVVDLLENPQLARGDQILAIPTLVRKLPTPIKKIIGDLSNTERTLVGLDLLPAHGPGKKTDA